MLIETHIFFNWQIVSRIQIKNWFWAPAIQHHLRGRFTWILSIIFTLWQYILFKTHTHTCVYTHWRIPHALITSFEVSLCSTDRIVLEQNKFSKKVTSNKDWTWNPGALVALLLQCLPNWAILVSVNWEIFNYTFVCPSISFYTLFS